MQLSAVPFHSKGSPNMVHSFGVKKGAWTKDEDVLLRKCIEKYGEGNWRQVPLKAGLNRCRKSCRLRWLNYLHPNIKRGEFAADEVDLIIRMHKLLGNRWSLIAGRLPGRTANDVKNYWNTHLHKKLIRSQSEVRVTYKTQVIKPHPRTFSRTSQWLRRNKLSEQTMTCKDLSNNKSPVSEVEKKEEKSWWETLLFDNNEEIDYSCSVSRSGEQIIPSSFCVNGVESKTSGGTISKSTISKSYWDDMYVDVNVWDLLVPEEEQVM